VESSHHRAPFAGTLLALLAALLPCCDARQTAAQGGPAALARNLAHARAVEIHVDEETLAEPIRRLAARERARCGRDVHVVVHAPGDPRAARIVIGTPESERAAALAEFAGIAVHPVAAQRPTGRGGFRVAELDFYAPDDALRATFEDPERPGSPVTLWLGNDLARLVPQIESALPLAAPTLAAWRGGELVLTGVLKPGGGLVANRLERIAFARFALSGPAALVSETDGFRIESVAGVPRDSIDAVRQHLRAARERAATWCDVPIPSVHVRLLADVADLCLAGEDARLGRWNRARPAADMLVVDGVTDGGAAALRAGLRAALEPAVVPWIEEGATIAAAGSWWGHDLDRWLARIVRAGDPPRVRALVDPRSDTRVSAHVLAPLRAALFEHLRATRGDAFVRAVWCGTRQLDVDDALESEFESALHARVASRLEEVAALGRARRAQAFDAPPLAGVVFAPSGPDPRVGYGSRLALAALRTLHESGVRSVALQAEFVDSSFGGGGWIEPKMRATTGDVAFFATAVAARGAGLRVALFPCTVTSAAGSFADAWTQDGTDAASDPFARAARVVEHAAWLATSCDMDWLSIGSGMRAASDIDSVDRRTSPGERAWKQAGWRRVIGAARGAFSGGLTYEAADLHEAERVGFWSDLDAIGVELDLRVGPDVADRRLELERGLSARFAELAQLAGRVERPVLLTRVTLSLDPAAGSDALFDPTSMQLRTLDAAARSATTSGQFGIPAVWLARVSTDPSSVGLGPRDSVLRGDRMPAIQPFLAGVAGWVRGESRAGGRSPR
jgi:hypothetical protein